MNAHAQVPKNVRRGVWMFPGVAAGALLEAVVATEQLGLDEVWIADEGVAREPVAVLAAAAMQTNLVDLMGDSSCDPVRLVERAEELLHSLQPGS